MKKLFAGPFVGEFGHELFCWQGKIRRLSKEYDYTKIVCLKGHDVLYSDFADEIIEYEPQTYIPDCSKNKGTTKNYPIPFSEEEKYIGPNTQIIKIYDTDQDFVKLGTLDDKLQYDFILSARNTNKCETGYRDWDHVHWNSLTKKLLNDGYKIACIGKSGMSYKIPNIDNYMDIPLNKLSNIVHSSKYIVGGSSGPMHFATLCGTSQIVWSGDNIHTNKTRYLDWWNPFKTSVSFVPAHDWNPKVDKIYEECTLAINEN
jgi:hypothetical protein